LHLAAIEAVQRVSIERQLIVAVGEVQRLLAHLVRAAATCASLIRARQTFTPTRQHARRARSRLGIRFLTAARKRHRRQLDGGRRIDRHFDLAGRRRVRTFWSAE
jgi:hypothetical protein